jgi:hypothetical protein
VKLIGKTEEAAGPTFGEAAKKRQEPTTPTTSPQTGPRPRALLLTVVSVHMKRHSINIRPPGEWKVTGDYSPVLN